VVVAVADAAQQVRPDLAGADRKGEAAQGAKELEQLLAHARGLDPK
jgi:hypothetical protein